MNTNLSLHPATSPRGPGAEDLTYLADVLIDLTLPERTGATPTLTAPTVRATRLTTRTGASGSAPNGERREPTVIIDLVDDGHPQPAEMWALCDDSEVGQVVSPLIMRRLRLRWTRHRTGVELDSPRAVYYPSIRGFAQRHASRLSAPCPELGPRVQHRIEGFLQLDDDDFNACYNYLGDPTPEYLRLSRRLDDQPLDDRPSARCAPGGGHRRRAKAVQLDLRDRPS
jgi:hypothetical protein